MRVVVKALPVLYACQGCAEFGQLAREIGAALDRRRLAEMIWLGAPNPKPTTRFPIFALDGCEKGCARRWLEQRDLTPQRHLVATDVERISAQIR